MSSDISFLIPNFFPGTATGSEKLNLRINSVAFLNSLTVFQACGQVWIWGGGAFPAEVDFYACFLGESGLFHTHFVKKWTILRAFVKEVDFFASSPDVGGMFLGKI